MTDTALQAQGRALGGLHAKRQIVMDRGLIAAANGGLSVQDLADLMGEVSAWEVEHELRYAIAEGFRGVMIWDITQDHLAGAHRSRAHMTGASRSGAGLGGAGIRRRELLAARLHADRGGEHHRVDVDEQREDRGPAPPPLHDRERSGSTGPPLARGARTRVMSTPGRKW